MRSVSHLRSAHPSAVARRRQRHSQHLAALDRLLNARVVSAPDDAAQNAAMQLKLLVKRQFAILPDDAIEPAARAVLEELSHGA